MRTVYETLLCFKRINNTIEFPGLSGHICSPPSWSSCLIPPSGKQTQGKHSPDHLSSVNRRSGAEVESAGLQGQPNQFSSRGCSIHCSKEKSAGVGQLCGYLDRARKYFQELLTCKTHERPTCPRGLFAILSDRSLTMWR